MRIGVIGAGAIGCAVTARLARAGHDVALVVRDETRRAILGAEGLTCIEASETVTAAPSVVAALSPEPLDVLFLAVKAADLPQAAAAVAATTVGADTRIVPLVNGIPWWLRLGRADADVPILAVDPGGALLHRFPARQIIGSVVYTTAMMTGPATVQVTRNQSMILGQAVEGDAAPLATLVEALSAAGIVATPSDRIRDDVWTKVALNLATNPLSVVVEAGLGDLCSDERLLPIVSTILDETWRVAARYDARPFLTRSEMIARGRAAGAFRTSMLEDFRSRRPLELGAIADAVLELAAVIGLDMPVARSVADLARYRAACSAEEMSQ